MNSPGQTQQFQLALHGAMMRVLLAAFIGLALAPAVCAQTGEKEVNDQFQTWVSVNVAMRLTTKWGVMTDLHLRTNHSFASTSFVLGRIGAVYWLSGKTTLAAGYTRIDVAPVQKGATTFSGGNWIYQQVQHVNKIGNAGFTARLRNEQRWQQQVVNDSVSGTIFSNRVRLLAYVTIPVSRHPYVPSIALADELMVQFGKDIVYNTFDQNRLFAGLRQPLSKTLSFDIGYMLVYQQRPSGYQFNRNHTLRCFFYYRPDWRKQVQ